MNKLESFESLGRLYSLMERRRQFVDAISVIDDLAGSYFGKEFDTLMKVRELLWDHFVFLEHELVKQRKNIVEKAEKQVHNFDEWVSNHTKEGENRHLYVNSHIE